MIIILGLTVLMLMFGQFSMQLFIDPAETAIMDSSMQYVRITSVFRVIIIGVNFIVCFALTGVGKTITPMAVGISEILTRAAVTYLPVYRIGFMGMIFVEVRYKTLSFSQIKDRHGTYALIGKDDNREREVRKLRPSVRAQLAQEEKRTVPKKAATKKKDHGLEV